MPPSPLATADIAETPRPAPQHGAAPPRAHARVGLLAVESDATGRARPAPAPLLAGARRPGLGLEPPSFPMLARMLLRLAEATGAGADEAADAGRDQGQADAAALAGRELPRAAVEAALAALGFDPAVAAEDGVASVAFTHCPFRELAETRPDLVCNLHRGLVEGWSTAWAAARSSGFGTLVDRDPCRVDLVPRRRDDLDQADEPVPVAGR